MLVAAVVIDVEVAAVNIVVVVATLFFVLVSTVNGVRVKQCIRSPLFERLFRRISFLHVTSRWGGCYVLYVSRALRRKYTLFYPVPCKCSCSCFYAVMVVVVAFVVAVVKIPFHSF